jgi:hypothetical protein
MIEHMFEAAFETVPGVTARGAPNPDGVGDSHRSVDRLERCLAEAAGMWSRAVAAMLPAIRALDVAQVDLVDGSRSMVEWLSARLDCDHPTARRLLGLARSADAEVEERLAAGEVSVDRASAVVLLKATGAPPEEMDRSFGLDLAGVRRLTNVRTALTAGRERELFDSRFLCVQPSLDDTVWRLWGQLAGLDGRIVEQALERQVDEFPDHPGIGAAQRRADALVAICQDSLTGPSGGGRAVIAAEVFVDGPLAAATHGEQGATVVSGVRVGPTTLAEIVCRGTVGVTISGPGFRPLAVSLRRNAIPPATRRAVLMRDRGVCTIEGCRSQRRLQPHHLVEQAVTVDHSIDNLTTVCWYHHHVVIHQMGYRLDPHTPPGRRRFLSPGRRAGPG